MKIVCRFVSKNSSKYLESFFVLCNCCMIANFGINWSILGFWILCLIRGKINFSYYPEPKISTKFKAPESTHRNQRTLSQIRNIPKNQFSAKFSNFRWFLLVAKLSPNIFRYFASFPSYHVLIWLFFPNRNFCIKKFQSEIDRLNRNLSKFSKFIRKLP